MSSKQSRSVGNPEKGPRKGRGGSPASGRSRRPTISEKEQIEKARSAGRRAMGDVMAGWLEDLKAVEVVFYQGVEVATLPHFVARAEARRQIAERCGFRFDPNEAPSDVGRALLEIFSKFDAGSSSE